MCVFMQKQLQYIFILVSFVLVACGGGGGGTAGSGGSETYLAVTGVKNVTGKPVQPGAQQGGGGKSDLTICYLLNSCLRRYTKGCEHF
jgi:hypothetical protein